MQDHLYCLTKDDEEDCFECLCFFFNLNHKSKNIYSVSVNEVGNLTEG